MAPAKSMDFPCRFFEVRDWQTLPSIETGKPAICGFLVIEWRGENIQSKNKTLSRRAMRKVLSIWWFQGRSNLLDKDTGIAIARNSR